MTENQDAFLLDLVDIKEPPLPDDIDKKIASEYEENKLKAEAIQTPKPE